VTTAAIPLKLPQD